MRVSLYALAALILSFSPAAEAAGKRCEERVISAMVREMLSPCGRPEGHGNTLSIYYVDPAQGMPRHIPQKYCGWGNSEALGLVKIRIQPLAGTDCRIRSIKLLR